MKMRNFLLVILAKKFSLREYFSDMKYMIVDNDEAPESEKRDLSDGNIENSMSFLLHGYYNLCLDDMMYIRSGASVLNPVLRISLQSVLWN